MAWNDIPNNKLINWNDLLAAYNEGALTQKNSGWGASTRLVYRDELPYWFNVDSSVLPGNAHQLIRKENVKPNALVTGLFFRTQLNGVYTESVNNISPNTSSGSYSFDTPVSGKATGLKMTSNTFINYKTSYSLPNSTLTFNYWTYYRGINGHGHVLGYGLPGTTLTSNTANFPSASGLVLLNQSHKGRSNTQFLTLNGGIFNEDYVENGIIPASNQWSMITWVIKKYDTYYQGSLYIDGVFKRTSGNVTSNFISQQNVCIGIGVQNNTTSTVADIRIYNALLSQSEITTLFNSTKPSYK